MSQNDISNDEFSMEMERIYMNSMQVMVNLLDPNKVVWKLHVRQVRRVRLQ